MNCESPLGRCSGPRCDLREPPTLLEPRQFFVPQSDAFAVAVDASTLVTEMFGASACHMIASACPFDPERTVRALFKIAAFNVVQEYGLLFSVVTRLVLFASLPFMIVNFAC